MIWNYDINEIAKGYYETEDKFICLICDKEFVKGQIYKQDDSLFDAHASVKSHVKSEHKSVAAYLLDQELSNTGLTEIQRKLLKLIMEGKSDGEISSELGIAKSTVRNHRFKLREKEKQAKLYTALMISLEEETNKKIDKSDLGVIEEVSSTAKMVDDRYSITDKDRKKTIETYMDENGALKQFPAKEKKKIIVLGEIMKNFKRNVEYTEGDVDKVLKRIFDDHVTLRRALIEYGFMDRSVDCKVYRVKE